MNKIIEIALLISSIVFLTNECLGGDNFGTWNTVQVTMDLEEDGLYAGVSEESRIGTRSGESPKRMDEFHTTAFLDWKLFDWMTVGVQDDFVLLRDGSDKRYKRDERPGVNIAFSQSLWGFDIMNRSRFVDRDIEGERPHFRYRNLTKLTAPAVFHAWGRPVRPYASYEWYFDEGSKDREIRKNDKFGQFWTDFGLQISIYDGINMAVFYRLVEIKSTESHDWSPVHVVGIGAYMLF